MVVVGCLCGGSVGGTKGKNWAAPGGIGPVGATNANGDCCVADELGPPCEGKIGTRHLKGLMEKTLFLSMVPGGTESGPELSSINVNHTRASSNSPEL